jgi:hypothetical protein
MLMKPPVIRQLNATYKKVLRLQIKAFILKDRLVSVLKGAVE